MGSLARSWNFKGNTDKEHPLADGDHTGEKASSPLGVLLIIFESRPDALVQVSRAMIIFLFLSKVLLHATSLAVREVGNGLLLKGGRRLKRSNAILHKLFTLFHFPFSGFPFISVITSSIPPTVGRKTYWLDDVIDLVIPRGSNKLVSQIKAATKIPVLGHADGICHVFIDKSADLDMAKRIVLDAKTDYPAACNAMETLLVHEDLVQTGGLNDLILELQEKGVSLFGGPKASSVLSIPEANSFHHEYGALACTVEIVEDVNTAIEHIHRHGRQVTFLITIQF
ncbi:hypothetical protein R3W88_016299 [Solanum pinnatisectum]|uniref:Pyrroline-5-carboxylate synthetase n=1 Tax=Solanum pinnatisectum TaxID=50273 RepID=A0AAV9KXA6_9SOLN|nr:hypothetical protein R3W88_016299 [Solanum pinnatisectum]